MIVKMTYYPLGEKSVESYHDLNDVVMKVAVPGQIRRSVLGMIGTKGEYSVLTYLENVLWGIKKYVNFSHEIGNCAVTEFVPFVSPLVFQGELNLESTDNNESVRGVLVNSTMCFMLHSYDKKKKHIRLNEFIGKKVRLNLEVI